MIFFNTLKPLAEAAKTDPQAREKLIRQKEQSILRIASKTCGRFISTSDDEWSVALCAFSRSIDTYDASRGDFMAYAAALIRRDLIDEHRRAERHSRELLVSPAAFEGNFDEDDVSESAAAHAVVKSSMEASVNSSAAEEIAALSSELSAFGFGFMELTECSPKQERTRRECQRAASFLAADTALYEKMTASRQLPASQITKQTGVSARLLEKYRKYIITAAMILNGDYPCLAEYLKPRERRQQT